MGNELRRATQLCHLASIRPLPWPRLLMETQLRQRSRDIREQTSRWMLVDYSLALRAIEEPGPNVDFGGEVLPRGPGTDDGGLVGAEC
jgi:hypothetical protein